MTTEDYKKFALAMKKGQVINYGGMLLKAIPASPDWVYSLCQVCPIESKCTCPISTLCAFLEKEEPKNWVMEEIKESES